jgi:hypothetical protein
MSREPDREAASRDVDIIVSSLHYCHGNVITLLLVLINTVHSQAGLNWCCKYVRAEVG